ncbi:MAG: hypothetical protein COA36_01015 [Desulfotalea sp.]|nr:MAG: hypothetical protein COA36_01015 [Desulfotalea sp.]
MVEQYTDNQYDDDLTAESGEYDDSYYTGAEDLFDYTPDEESPISRLKSLVLSIDWEITDDVLMEFNEELLDLRDIWADEKINLVYVQALEKLSKYIYQKKADSHPSAIKLLLTLYHNLEKIVSSDDLSDAEKKAILVEDVKRFENLKSHLKTHGTAKVDAQPKSVFQPSMVDVKKDEKNDLFNLKAIVLSIDWEITDEDLGALRQEVTRLEALFAGSRPRLILLQGIGTLGAYIKTKKSDSHADAFNVLHLFFECLEKIVDTAKNLDEEKAILFPAVEKFNQFKLLLGETISPASIRRSEDNNEEKVTGSKAGTVAPAFAELSEDDVIGFQADDEAAALGLDSPDNVSDHVASFFGEDSSSDEDIYDDSPVAKTSDGVADTSDVQALESVVTEEEPPVEIMFPDADDIVTDFSTIDKSVALQGVDVESEADDDSDEDALPLLEGKLAPALADNDEVSVYNAETVDGLVISDEQDNDVTDTFLGVFEDEAVGEQASVDPEEINEQAPDVIGEDFVTEVPVEVAEDAPAGIITELSEGYEGVPALHEFDSDSPARLSDETKDESELHFVADIENQLDDFFGTEDQEGEESSAEMFASMAVAENGADPLNDVFTDSEEEEVIFELVEETVEIDSGLEPTDAILIPDGEHGVDAQIASLLGDSFADAGTVQQDDGAASEDTLDDLGTCIDSVALELEDTVLNGLLEEIDAVEQQWADRPLDKTFLHLLRTTACHIDQYRYEAGSDAYTLLQSVYGALLLSQTAVDQRQELLFAQTVKVLDWQQTVIEKNSRAVAEDLLAQELAAPDDQMLTFEDELLGDVEKSEDSVNESQSTGNLKDQISTLRKSLQDEISVLKNKND